mmetsp:Transcript_10789/g.34590  ORF Transcript_10789/g.34590 Transcript_10789/m.34590 type:complete len:788 (-) Transcript_10789:698-3061(-)
MLLHRERGQWLVGLRPCRQLGLLRLELKPKRPIGQCLARGISASLVDVHREPTSLVSHEGPPGPLRELRLRSGTHELRLPLGAVEDESPRLDLGEVARRLLCQITVALQPVRHGRLDILGELRGGHRGEGVEKGSEELTDAALDLEREVRRRDHRHGEPEHLKRVARAAMHRVAELLFRAQRVKKRLVHQMLEERQPCGQAVLRRPELPVRLDGGVGVGRVLRADRPHQPTAALVSKQHHRVGVHVALLERRRRAESGMHRLAERKGDRRVDVAAEIGRDVGAAAEGVRDKAGELLRREPSHRAQHVVVVEERGLEHAATFVRRAIADLEASVAEPQLVLLQHAAERLAHLGVVSPRGERCEGLAGAHAELRHLVREAVHLQRPAAGRGKDLEAQSTERGRVALLVEQLGAHLGRQLAQQSPLDRRARARRTDLERDHTLRREEPAVGQAKDAAGLRALQQRRRRRLARRIGASGGRRAEEGKIGRDVGVRLRQRKQGGPRGVARTATRARVGFVPQTAPLGAQGRANAKLRVEPRLDLPLAAGAGRVAAVARRAALGDHDGEEEARGREPREELLDQLRPPRGEEVVAGQHRVRLGRVEGLRHRERDPAAVVNLGLALGELEPECREAAQLLLHPRLRARPDEEAEEGEDGGHDGVELARAARGQVDRHGELGRGGGVLLQPRRQVGRQAGRLECGEAGARALVAEEVRHVLCRPAAVVLLQRRHEPAEVDPPHVLERLDADLERQPVRRKRRRPRREARPARLLVWDGAARLERPELQLVERLLP